ncbi:MAG TPA: hypothetical protein VJP02_25205 [Candidatus Sulfotelmatobacter sp.]|nr:hypothetical protein [Candidatus Sulfotelmatobacter sp.]
MTNDEVMEMEEAKLVAHEEAKAVVNEARRGGEKDEAVLTELYNEVYVQALAEELGVEMRLTDAGQLFVTRRATN